VAKRKPKSETQTQAPARVVIEHPIINSPFEVPQRHYQFGDHGITNKILHGRRDSS